MILNIHSNKDGNGFGPIFLKNFKYRIWVHNMLFNIEDAGARTGNCGALSGDWAVNGGL